MDREATIAALRRDYYRIEAAILSVPQVKATKRLRDMMGNQCLRIVAQLEAMGASI